MGCDIHMTVDVLKDGQWVDCGFNVDQYGAKLYLGRNYDLFACLADVRNGRGFAGRKTGEGFNPISEPRGLPEGRTEDGPVDEEGDHTWPYGEHSFSWLLLSEVIENDWSQETIKYGVMPVDQYDEWKASGETWPQSWSGGVMGHGISTINEDDYLKALKSGKFESTQQICKEVGCERLYIRGKWKVTYAECCEYFLETWVPELRGRLKDYELEEIRLVFGFDS